MGILVKGNLLYYWDMNCKIVFVRISIKICVKFMSNLLYIYGIVIKYNIYLLKYVWLIFILFEMNYCIVYFEYFFIGFNLFLVIWVILSWKNLYFIYWYKKNYFLLV